MSRPTPDYFGQSLRPGQADALQRLYNAIQAALEADPRSVLCVGSNRHWWTSSHPASIRSAQAGCQSCPLIKQCGRYARKFSESSGVWGGKRMGSNTGEQTEIRELMEEENNDINL